MHPDQASFGPDIVGSVHAGPLNLVLRVSWSRFHSDAGLVSRVCGSDHFRCEDGLLYVVSCGLTWIFN